MVKAVAGQGKEMIEESTPWVALREPVAKVAGGQGGGQRQEHEALGREGGGGEDAEPQSTLTTTGDAKKLALWQWRHGGGRGQASGRRRFESVLS